MSIAHPLRMAIKTKNRYFENVRRAVMARLGRLSNDELAGEEDAVMTVMNSLGDLMSVMDAKFNVSEAISRPLNSRGLVLPSYSSKWHWLIHRSTLVAGLVIVSSLGSIP